MLKKITASLIAAMFTAVTVSAAPWVSMKITYNYNTYNYNAEAVYVNVNGQKLTNLPMQPILLDNTTLVPAREVCEAFGAVVEWKKPTEEIYIACGDSIVVLKINSKSANVNGTVKELSVPARIINNKTMVPVRFVSEAFDKEVVWSNPERTIYIKDKEAAPQGTAVQAAAAAANAQASTNQFDQKFMYDSVNKTIVVAKDNPDFSSDGSEISYEEGDKLLKMVFTGNVCSSVKQGEYKVATNGVEYINYAVEDGKTVIKVKSENKLEPTIESDKTYIYVTLK